MQGASKNLLGSLQLHGVFELWPPEVSILMENLRDCRPKIAISRNFWHFSNFDVFLKGEPRGIQKPKRNLPNSCGTWDMAAGSFNFIGKHEGGLNKNRDFLKFRFSDPFKAQNNPQRGPPPRSFDRALFFFGVYRYLLVMHHPCEPLHNCTLTYQKTKGESC